MKLLKPILDTHPEWFAQTNIIYDAEAIFVSREITSRQLSGTPLSAEEADALLQEEVDCASAADCVIAVSEMDAGEFRKYTESSLREGKKYFAQTLLGLGTGRKPTRYNEIRGAADLSGADHNALGSAETTG